MQSQWNASEWLNNFTPTQMLVLLLHLNTKLGGVEYFWSSIFQRTDSVGTGTDTGSDLLCAGIIIYFSHTWNVNYHTPSFLQTRKLRPREQKRKLFKVIWFVKQGTEPSFRGLHFARETTQPAKRKHPQFRIFLWSKGEVFLYRQSWEQYHLGFILHYHQPCKHSLPKALSLSDMLEAVEQEEPGSSRSQKSRFLLPSALKSFCQTKQ